MLVSRLAIVGLLEEVGLEAVVVPEFVELLNDNNYWFGSIYSKEPLFGLH